MNATIYIWDREHDPAKNVRARGSHVGTSQNGIVICNWDIPAALELLELAGNLTGVGASLEVVSTGRGCSPYQGTESHAPSLREVSSPEMCSVHHQLHANRVSWEKDVYMNYINLSGLLL